MITSEFDKEEAFVPSSPQDGGSEMSHRPAHLHHESSSDESDGDISETDLSYLRKSEKQGYLLKQSRRDRDIWRKRYCVLTDKLWVRPCCSLFTTFPHSSQSDWASLTQILTSYLATFIFGFTHDTDTK